MKNCIGSPFRTGRRGGRRSVRISGGPRRVKAKACKSRAMPRRPPLRALKTGTDPLAFARTVLEAEANAILSLRERLDDGFVQAVELMLACTGDVVVTGIGKPGFIAQKLSA